MDNITSKCIEQILVLHFHFIKQYFGKKKHLFTQNTLEKTEMIHILYHYK